MLTQVVSMVPADKEVIILRKVEVTKKEMQKTRNQQEASPKARKSTFCVLFVHSVYVYFRSLHKTQHSERFLCNLE